MNIPKKLLDNINFGLLINVILICMLGIVTISNATQALKGGTLKFFEFQIIWTIVGLGLLIATVLIDYNTIKQYYKLIFFANLVLLLVVVALGKVVNGANSWMKIGTFGIEPSEFMGLSLIIVLAKKIEEYEGNINNLKNISILFLYAIPPIILIYMQPNLGMALVLVAIVIGMLFMGGLNFRIFFGGIIASAAAVLGVWFSPIQILKVYQKNRISIFLNPQNDQLGAGYHIMQSKLAIGSGELFGMGLGHGIISQSGYLPEAQTDFIFSVLGEQFGFIGTCVLVILYALIIFNCLKIARLAKDKFGDMVVIGVVSMLMFHIVENIGMTIGLMPVAGITLPFMSYGGSSMLTNMIAIGLVLNVRIRKNKINFSSSRNPRNSVIIMGDN